MSNIVSSKKNLIKSLFEFLPDLLLIYCLLFQDIYRMRLFGTPFYKYLIILILVLLIVEFFRKKKEIRLNSIYLLVLLFIYLYTVIVSFSKTIIVPSIFFVLEVFAVILFIQRFKDKEEFKKRIINIIYFSSIVIAILGIIQFAAFKLHIPVIYKNMTQVPFYLPEGRITSLYSEPAHLCALLCAGVFISMMYLFKGKSKINYIFLVLLLFATILSGSVVVYFSFIVFILLIIIYIIFKRKDKVDLIKKNVIRVIVISLITIGLSFSLFERDIFVSFIFKIGGFKESYSYKEKNKIEYSQLSNSSPYALKSNFYIGVEKMKDKYYLGTGLFTHIDYYDKYMERKYPHGYVRFNYADAASMPLRIFSELGIIGVVIFIVFLTFILIRAIRKKDWFIIFIMAVFVTQSIRLGEYNWILNCFSFVILLEFTNISSKHLKNIVISRGVKNE